MKKKTVNRKLKDELRDEYDLSKLGKATRGKYLKRYQSGTNLVLLSPDIAAHFPDAKSVDSALRSLIQLAKGSVRKSRR